MTGDTPFLKRFFTNVFKTVMPLKKGPMMAAGKFFQI